MELRQIASIVWKWTWLVVLAVVIAAVSSYAASKAATPIYRTGTTLMIGRVTQNPDPNTYELYTSQQLAYTYIQLAKREPVLKGAIERLGLQMDWQSLAGQVNAANVPNTQLLEINVIDTDPYRAKVLADAVAQQLIELSPGTANQSNSEQNAFTQAQLEDLKKKIEDGQNESIQLGQELDAANSASQIQDLQTRINVLDNKISGWQNTYSTLLISYQGSDVSSLSVLEEAQIPSAPFSPNVRNNVLIAALIGLALSMGGAFLIEYLDDTLKNPEEVTRSTNLPNLASVPFIEGDEYPNKLAAVNQPLSPVVEAFRVLRTNLQFSTLDRPLATLMLTSPSPSEGKSVALANLAVVLAQSGRKVIIVDTDLRRPTQHRIFNLSNRQGLTDMILEVIAPNADTIRSSKSYHRTPGWVTGRDEPEPTDGSDAAHDVILKQPLGEAKPSSPGFSPDLSRFLQETSVESLYLLSTGQLPPNPAELLGSEMMGMLIHVLKNQADIVLFDSPPTLVFTDAAVLSTRVDGVLMVFDAGRTRRNEAARTVEELRRVRANLLGALLNRAGRKQGNYYYYYYYYSKDGERRKKRRNPFPFNLGFKPAGVSSKSTSQKSHSTEPIPTSANED